MRDLFGVQVGLSDYTMGVGVGVASIAFGATVIEKISARWLRRFP